jgi:hypothetical protein
MNAVTASMASAAQAQAAQAKAALAQAQARAAHPAIPPGQAPVAMGAVTPVRSSWTGPPASPHQPISGSMPSAPWPAGPPTPMGAPGAAPWSPPVPRAVPAPPPSSGAPVFVLLVFLIGALAAGGFFGWRYWHAHHLVQSGP